MWFHPLELELGRCTVVTDWDVFRQMAPVKPCVCIMVVLWVLQSNSSIGKCFILSHAFLALKEAIRSEGMLAERSRIMPEES